MVRPKPKILGQLLVEAGALSREALEAALTAQSGTGLRLGAVLVQGGWTDEETVARWLAVQLSLPYQPPPLRPEPGATVLVRPELARRGRVLPLTATSRSLTLAMADPLDVRILDDVQFQCSRRVEPVVASPGAVTRGLALAYGGEVETLLQELPAKWRNPEADEVGALEEVARSAPVVRLVDHILQEAADQGASDIHLEEQGGELRVRFRQDGVLRRVLGLPSGSQEAVLSRLKIMAGMDISVKRRPQDGGMLLRRGEGGRGDLTLRVSSLPAGEGEKAVVRILDPARVPRNLAELGLSPEDLASFRRLLRCGQGVILAAGPTGSGKSSTLFAAMEELDRESQNVVTLEDPVEYRLPGANQIQVNPKAGLTFPAALRAVLRQDPDVIMVGEIRDRETAEIAMAAAVTGHLVLSTIHTVDAPGAITRLLNMGVPPYLVADGLAGVVAQRLVRKVCRRCGGRKGEGCSHCSGGYRGRTGVFQILVMNDALREGVAQGASLTTLRRLSRDGGMGSLKEDAFRKISAGITTPHEVARVVQSDAGSWVPCRRCRGEVPRGALACPWCGDLRRRLCGCGEELREEWRFCPACARPLHPA